MRFSFITASYNYEKYIVETIKSVIAQTVQDWEMIIVDDGSKDNSVEVIKKFCAQDKRIKLFRHPHGANCGLAKTLQLGLQNAQGTWVAFLESDDTLAPNYLEEKIKIIEQYKSVKFIFNDVQPIGDKKDIQDLNSNIPHTYFQQREQILKTMSFPTRPFAQFKNFNFIPSFSCVMLKKTILDGVDFNSPIPQWLDTYLWSQLVGKYEFFYINKFLTNWRLHQDSYNHNIIPEEQKQIFMDKVHQIIADDTLSFWKKIWGRLRQKGKSIIRLHLKKKEIILFNKQYVFSVKKSLCFPQKLISIILPVYNAEKNIAKCLESLLNQTHSNLEIIIVYLKGTDKTLEIIQSFNDPRIKIIAQETKTGPGGARNIGLDHVSGEYVGFIEADDYIPADFYHKLYQSLLSNSADMAIGEIVEPRPDNTKIYLTQIYKTTCKKALSAKLKTMTNGAAFNKLIKTSVIEQHKIRFAEHYRFEDNPWLLKVLYYSQKIVLVKGATYFYCCQGENWTEKYINFLKESIPPIAQEMNCFAKENHFSHKEIDLLGQCILNSFVRNFIQDEKVYHSLVEILGEKFFYKHAKELKKKYGFQFISHGEFNKKHDAGQ